MHRFDDGNFNPGMKTESKGGISKDRRKIFVPWSLHEKSWQLGTQDYIYIFESVLFPICQEFGPDLVIVSFGFTACRDHPMGELTLDPEAYAYMTSKLSQLAQGRMIYAFEGGMLDP